MPVFVTGMLPARSAMLRVAAVLATGAMAGWLTGYFWPVLVGSLSAYLFWHLLTLFRFERWLEDPEVDADPGLTGAWGQIDRQVGRLIGRNRKTRSRIRTLAREIRKVTTAIPDGAVILDQRNRILRTNQAAADLAGIAASDRGRGIDTLLRQPVFVGPLASGDLTNPVEIQSPVRPGVWLSISLAPYGTGERLLLIRDVTAERAAQRARRDFVANASHELRTPLTVISGYLDAMETDEALAPDWSKPLHQMQMQARRMRNIIGDLLELSRLDSVGAAHSSPIDVGGLLSLVCQEARALKEPPPDIEVSVESTDKLLGVEGEIHSAFANLVINAVQHTRAGERIGMRWFVDTDGGHFEVRDEGVGIESGLIPRLTERFFRVESSRVRRDDGGGTGLGLAIVKHVLNRHEATLRIASEPGVGSMFSCHFPSERIRPADATGDTIQGAN